jgi:hypothetical protein
MVTQTETTEASASIIDVNAVNLTKPETGLTVTTPAAGGKFKLAADVIQKACADLPDDDRADLMWFAGFCRRKDFSKAELGKLLRKPGSTDFYSADSLAQLLTGGRIRRGENISPMLEAIRHLRRAEEPRERQVKGGFIETRMYLEIEKRMKKAVQRQRVFFCFGDSQTGKTWSFIEVARRLGGVYVEMPASGNLGQFLRAVARAVGIPEGLRQTDLMERCIEAFDGNTPLLVDEAHRALGTRFTSTGVAIFSWLRELINRKSTPIGISFTNEGRDKFLKGPLAKTFQQFWRRRVPPLQLPPAPPDDDAARFAAAYGLEPAPDKVVKTDVFVTDEQGNSEKRTFKDNPYCLQRDVLNKEGLGVWITILQEASDMAQEQNRLITWAAVIKAHAEMQADAELLV